MARHHATADLQKLAEQWIAVWNTRDLDQVLALYRDDAEMNSPKIPALGFDAGGTLHGKENLRAYWSKALTFRPKLHFTLVQAFMSPDSVIVYYRDEAEKKVFEYLRVDDAGKIKQASGNYPVG